MSLSSLVSVTIRDPMGPTPRPMTPEELDQEFPLGQELGPKGIDRLLSLIHPTRSPFPAFRFEHEVNPHWGRTIQYSTDGKLMEVWLRFSVTAYDLQRPGEPLDITFEERVTLCHGQCNRRWIQELVRRFLLKAYEHELDENLLVAGVRVFDPHEAKP